MPLEVLFCAAALVACVWFIVWQANKTNIRVLDQNARLTSAVLSLSKNKSGEQLAAQIEQSVGGAVAADVNAAQSRFSSLNGEHSLYPTIERDFPVGT